MPAIPTPFSLFSIRALSRRARSSSDLRAISSRTSRQHIYHLPEQHFSRLNHNEAPQSLLKSPPRFLSTPSHRSPPPHAPPKAERPDQPAYEMTFTCKPCSTRSTHRISKQGYHFGSVLITCPECRNRHVISDHLNIFGDKSVTVEDLMREQGQLVKKGTLSEDGDLEFWDDGSTTTRAKSKTGTEKPKEG